MLKKIGYSKKEGVMAEFAADNMVEWKQNAIFQLVFPACPVERYFPE